MPDTLRLVIVAVLGMVAIALAAGLWTLMRGNNARRSQMLMRWRVILQLVALAIIMAVLFYARPG